MEEGGGDEGVGRVMSGGSFHIASRAWTTFCLESGSSTLVESEALLTVSIRPRRHVYRTSHTAIVAFVGGTLHVVLSLGLGCRGDNGVMD